MAKDAIVSDEFAKKFAAEKETPYTRWVKSEGLDLISSTYVQNLHTVELKPWARRGGARRVHEPRGLAHLERLLRLRDPAGQDAQPAAAVVRRNHHDPERPRLDHGVERRRPAHDLRVEGRRAVRHSAQLLAPALQRLGPRSGALRLGDQRADRHQSLRGLRFHLRHQVRLQGPLQRRAGLFLGQGRDQGLPAGDQLRAGCGQPAADHGEGARRRRRPHPLQLRQELAEQPHLAIPDRHLQEGARARAGRACHHPVGRRLFADVAGGRQAALLQVGGRHHDRAAEHVAAPALQHRHHAGALSRLQARGRRDPQRPGRAEGLDQQAARRRPDRLLRRESGDAQGVRAGARQARPEVEDGQGLRRRAEGRSAGKTIEEEEKAHA